MADVRDILNIEVPTTPPMTKMLIFGGQDKVKKKPINSKANKRPEGMHREVFALLCTDNKDSSPLLPTDTGECYKRKKAQVGMRQSRKWLWTPFTNPARTDGVQFKHWQRVDELGKEYPFARFNKQVQVAAYTDAEYQELLQVDSWSREETDHLMDLARRFDLRFIVMHDRWNRARFGEKSVVELKDRYYKICSILAKVKGGSNYDEKMYAYDAEHEIRRKEQLRKLYDRTPEQVEEELMLTRELKKIEAKKKEREKKQQDLQKLIRAADSQEGRKADRKLPKKKFNPRPRVDSTGVELAGIKFRDMKCSGVFLRSQCMKLPAGIGQKKLKAIERTMQEYNIDLNPIPSDEICTHFNELRSDSVLLYELRSALAACSFELQTLKHHYEALNPGKVLEIPDAVSIADNIPPPQKGNSELIDVVGCPEGP